MENIKFSEKIKSLRKEKGITQEELAEKLYVSRTAVSKWESGVGYPSIESLKLLAEYFNVSIDEFVSSNQVLTFAEREAKTKTQKVISLATSIIDVFGLLLLFLPLFFTKESDKVIPVSIIYANGMAVLVKIIIYVLIGLSAVCGIVGLILNNLDGKRYATYNNIFGMVVSVLLLAMLILVRMPYACIFIFILFVIKVFFIIKFK